MDMRRTPRVIALLALVSLLAACGSAAEDADGTVDEAASDAGDEAAPDEVDAGDADAVRIGFLGELTGNFAIFGVPARNGMRLAVSEINAAGGVDGRPLELVERDTQGAPEEGVTALRGMIEREGVVAVGGLISSDVALASAREAEASEVPMLLVKAGSERVLTSESRYTFRTCLPAASMNLEPIAQFIEDEGLERVGAVVADYEWGRSIEAAIEEHIGPLDVELQIEVAPVPETDFTTYLRRLEELDPDVLIATGHPPGSGTLLLQAADLGFDGFVTGPNDAFGVTLESVGDAAFDRYVDISCADYASESYQDLAARYHAEFDGFMEDDAVAGYGQVTMVAEAIEATGSDDPAEVAGYLREATFELPGYAWDLAWTEWGEFAQAQPLLNVMRERTPPEGVNPDAEWYPETLFRSEPLEPLEPLDP
jgi:branched-chain amino acid transport system substrate-binding protein